MINAERPAGKVHHGRIIKRLREMFGLGREAPALAPGNDWSRKKGLPPERKQTVENAVPKQVTKILKILVEAIKHSGKAAIIHIISNAVNSDHATVQPT